MASEPTIHQPFPLGPQLDPCEDAGLLKAKAERCRRLAAGISDKQATDVLIGMARSYQDAADRLDRDGTQSL